MSELKQKILEGIRASGLKEWAFMVNCYDDIAEYENLTDEDIDELATDILNEINKQPTLNPNQQQVLGWLKIGHCDGDSVFEALERITYVYEDPKTEEALESLSPGQEAQVIQSFISWVLEQEESDE